jgi:hypothetical protein
MERSMRAERLTTDLTGFRSHTPEGWRGPPNLQGQPLDAAARLTQTEDRPVATVVSLHHGTIRCDEQAVNESPARREPRPPSAGFAWLLAEASVYHDPADHGWSRVR